jgi:hypothetical protein
MPDNELIVGPDGVRGRNELCPQQLVLDQQSRNWRLRISQ